MIMARFLSVGVAICFVLLVLSMASCFLIMYTMEAGRSVCCLWSV